MNIWSSDLDLISDLDKSQRLVSEFEGWDF